MKTVKEAIQTRYSARYFDKTKSIPQTDLDLIIEAGVRAPSGFASEPWKMFILRGNREIIFEAMNQQMASLEASEIIVMAYVKPAYIDEYPEFMDKFNRLGEEKNKIYQATLIKKAQTNYFKEQVMFAASQMVLQASGLNIDSLIMGGFDETKLLQVLKLDEKLYGIGVVLAFGYNKQAPVYKFKRPKEDVVSIIDLDK